MTVRVVFDTNVYISAFVIPGGNAEKAYLHAIRGSFELYSSVAILTELAGKLEGKFGWERQRVLDLIASVGDIAVVLRTSPHLKVLADDPDNRVLECALAADAHSLVTGDKHLLKLKQYGGVPIIKLADFLSELERMAPLAR